MDLKLEKLITTLKESTEFREHKEISADGGTLSGR